MGYLVNRCVRPGVAVQSALGDPDPLWDDVLSLVRFNESNGATSITDEKGLSWTVQGNATVSSASQKFGNNLNCNFDGSSSFSNMDIAYTNLGAQDFDTDDLHTEGWFRIDVDEDWNPIFHLGNRSNDYIQVQVDNGLSDLILQATGGFSTQTIAYAFSLNTWYYFTFTKTAAGAWAIYINGISIASGTGLSWNGSENFHLGYRYNGGVPVHASGNVRFDDWRTGLGIRRTGNFTPPAAEHPNFGP